MNQDNANGEDWLSREYRSVNKRAHDAEALLREEHRATMCILVPIEKVGKRDGITAPVRMCPPDAPCWWCKVDALLATLPAPIRMIIHCPKCKGQHVDRREWTTRVHRKHLCENCKHVWQERVYPTVGVETL